MSPSTTCCGTYADDSVTMLVWPEGTRQVAVDEAERVRLLPGEALFAELPVVVGGYFGCLLLLSQKPDPKVLRTALAKALAAQPAFAGRLVGDRKNGSDLVYTNSGVPFTVVRSKEASAPSSNELDDQYFRGASAPDMRENVGSGEVPLSTAKLTIYQDGSGIFTVGTSHCIADGTTLLAFVHRIAAAARGERVAPPPPHRRQDIRGMCLMSEEEFQTAFEARSGRRAKRGVVVDALFRAGVKMMNLLFRMRFYGRSGVHRPRISFSAAELRRIKDAATPAKIGGAWVTTQEALSAHVLLALARAILPPATAKRETRTGLLFILDARSALGLHEETPSGLLSTHFYVVIDNILQKTLPEAAMIIHDKLQEKPKVHQSMKDAWSLDCSASHHGYQATVRKSLRVAVVYKSVNNLSKHLLPDFGALGGGGQVPTFLPSSGPSLLVPQTDGAGLALSNESFMGASASKRREALRLLREIP